MLLVRFKHPPSGKGGGAGGRAKRFTSLVIIPLSYCFCRLHVARNLTI